MFGAQTEKAPWDKEQKYTPQNIEVSTVVPYNF